MPELMPADERAILAVYAEATKPLDWGDVVESLLPPRPRARKRPFFWRTEEASLPPRPSRSRRGSRYAWDLRWEEMVRAAMALYKAGLLAEMPDGPADMTVITEVGREVVQAMPTGLIVTDVDLSPEEAETFRRKWETEASTAPASTFWVDLNRRLQDSKFHRSYVKESLRIQEFDDRMNACPVDGAQAPAQPSSAPGSLPPRPGRLEAPHQPGNGVSR